MFDDGFAGALTPGRRPAVVVVDLMRAYFAPESPLCLPADRLPHDGLAAAARVIDHARGRGIPVIHTRVQYAEDGRDGGIFLHKVPALRLLMGEAPLGTLMPEVAPLPDEPVLVKQYASAFFGTPLEAQLRDAGVDTVVIVGVSTSGCVRATAVDALQHGFIPLVVRDAVMDRDASVHEASLFDLQAKYAEVVRLDAVLTYLGGLTTQESRSARTAEG